jgi:cell division transport system permease protein
MSAIAERIYALRRALNLVALQPGRYVLAVSLCAAALALPLLVAALAVAAAPAWKAVRAGPELSVFVRIGTPPGELQVLRERLAALDGVHAVRVIPRDQAFGELSKRLGLGATSSDARSNPLPDALVARFALTVDPAAVDRAAAASRQWPGVDAVQSDIEWYRRLVAARQFGTLVITGMAGLIGLLLFAALIAAAVLSVQVSAAEVAVLRLVGAQPEFVRRPYAYAGALALATGASVALAMTWATLSWIAPRLGPFAQHLDLSAVWPSDLAWLVPAVVMAATLGGGAVAALAARRQIGRSSRL